VTAWESAVTEYQSFHSIKSGKEPNKKEKEVILPPQPQSSSSLSPSLSPPPPPPLLPPPLPPLPLSSSSPSSKNNYDHHQQPPPNPLPYSTPTASFDPNSGWYSIPPKPIVPPMVSPDDDEALANLLMAWYYSGYYTGLYQAKRRK